MAMTLYETTLAAPNIIRFELREPDLVKPSIRDATAAELQVGGVFEPFTILSVSNANPAVFTASKSISPLVNDDFVRIAKAQGKTDINTTAKLANVSGATFTLKVQNSAGTYVDYNGAHGGAAYVANSARMSKLASGTGTSRKYILGGNLDKVKPTDYFPGPRGDRSTTTGARYLAGYAITGKTLTALGFETNAYDMGKAYNGSSVYDWKYEATFAFFVYLTASTNFSNGSYTVTFPSGLGISPQTITINDKTTRCCSIGVNQIGHKSTDESKVATLCQYLPQGANYGSMRFLTDYSITDYHLIDSSGTIVWSAGAAPILRLANTSVENGSTLDSISADPDAYGVDIAAVTRGATTTIDTVQPHGMITGDVCSLTYARGLFSGIDMFYQRGNYQAPTITRITDYQFTIPVDTSAATAWISGGKVTKHYSVNQAGVHTYEMDFSSFTGADGTYYLYIPGFGVSDPIYISAAAWAKVAGASVKALYHQALGLANDGRYGWGTNIAAAKVGVDGQTEILYSPLPHSLWTEQGLGRITVPVNPRFLSGTAPSELWGGMMDAADFDRLPGLGHISEICHMLGPKALVPLASRYTEHNFPSTKDTIGGTNYTSKFFSAEIDIALWYIDFARRTQAGDGGILSAVQFNNQISGGAESMAVQPSWHVNWNWVALAPDYISTIQYAYAAAMLAWHLKEMGKTALSDLFVASAQSAISYYDTMTAGTHPADNYSAAKALYTEQPLSLVTDNPLVFVCSPEQYKPLTNVDGVQVVASGFTGGYAVMNGVTYCLRQSGNNIAVYDSTNTTPVNASGYGAYTPDTGVFTYTTAAWRSIWDATVVSIHGFTLANLARHKAAASGILYNLTGTASYKTYHDANYNLGGEFLWGTYIYSLAAGATAAVVTNLYSSVASTCTNFIFSKGGFNDRSFTYFRMDSTINAYGGTIQAVYEYAASAMIAHKKAYADRIALSDTHAQAKANAGVKKYTKYLQDAYGFLLGINPPKICFVTGYGQRSPAKVTNINADATGQGPPPGVHPYWLPYFTNSYQVNANTYYWTNRAPLYDTGAASAGAVPNTDTELVPHRFARPRMMSYIPSPFLIEVTEYNVAKYYYFNGIANYLQYWEGSCVQADGKKRLIARAS